MDAATGPAAAESSSPPAAYQGFSNVVFIVLVAVAVVSFVLTAQQLILSANLPVIIITYAVLVRGRRAVVKCPPHRLTPAPGRVGC